MAKKIKGRKGYHRKTVTISPKKSGKGKHKGYTKKVWVKNKS